MRRDGRRADNRRRRHNTGNADHNVSGSADGHHRDCGNAVLYTEHDDAEHDRNSVDHDTFDDDSFDGNPGSDFSDQLAELSDADRDNDSVGRHEFDHARIDFQYFTNFPYFSNDSFVEHGNPVNLVDALSADRGAIAEHHAWNYAEHHTWHDAEHHARNDAEHHARNDAARRKHDSGHFTSDDASLDRHHDAGHDHDARHTATPGTTMTPGTTATPGTTPPATSGTIPHR